MQTSTNTVSLNGFQGYTRDSAFVYNQGIVTQNEYEALERSVNAIYLSTIAKQNYQLSASDSLTIFNIAGLCPALGGSAVYMARSIVVLFNDTLAFDDDSLCIAQGVWLRQAGNSNEATSNVEKGIGVYPNPTNDVLYFTFDETDEDSYMLEIFDMFGKMCYKSILRNTLNSISLYPPDQAHLLY
jgi:hypothetical protein